jgi:hypothetical protein
MNNQYLPKYHFEVQCEASKSVLVNFTKLLESWYSIVTAISIYSARKELGIWNVCFFAILFLIQYSHPLVHF